MKLVVDTNILFSFFKKDSLTRRLISNFKIFELYTPSFCLKELLKYKSTICEKSKISSREFNEALNILVSFLRVVDLSEYKEFLSKAKYFSPDPDDVDIFALALKLNCAIWSNDKRLKNQSEIKIFSTKELVRLFKIEM